jgi:hypothetical protein
MYVEIDLPDALLDLCHLQLLAKPSKQQELLKGMQQGLHSCTVAYLTGTRHPTKKYPMGECRVTRGNRGL